MYLTSQSLLLQPFNPLEILYRIPPNHTIQKSNNTIQNREEKIDFNQYSGFSHKRGINGQSWMIRV
ncbi:MAG: hypothetical protein EBV05_11665 [Cyanobacteria bacterium WB6_1B_304]|nr:hypothetical protein [Cyanobacteria bacterium WB6_1B_304]